MKGRNDCAASLFWPSLKFGFAGRTDVNAMLGEMKQDASRHRFKHAPPETPAGFWDMGFGDSQDSRVQQL